MINLPFMLIICNYIEVNFNWSLKNGIIDFSDYFKVLIKFTLLYYCTGYLVYSIFIEKSTKQTKKKYKKNIMN